MSKETLEHISSLVDGELSRETSLFLARRMATDTELVATWERYHLIRDSLRQPGGHLSMHRIRLPIDEAAPSGAVSMAVQSFNRPAWLKPVSGLAIAASVAVVAILLTAPSTGPVSQESVNAPFASPNTFPSIPITQPASLNGEQSAGAQRLNSYFLRHNQVAGTAGRQGFVSFVPMVTTVVSEPEAGVADAAVQGVAADSDGSSVRP